MDIEEFDKAVKAMQDMPSMPDYCVISDAIVDECLSQGIVPEFVMVSSRSYDKIQKYLKEHEVTD